VLIREIRGQKLYFPSKTNQFQPRMERIITDAIEGMNQRNPISSLIRANPWSKTLLFLKNQRISTTDGSDYHVLD
jgi:hypothetical protein